MLAGSPIDLWKILLTVYLKQRMVMALGVSKWKTLGLALFVFSFLVAAFGVTEETKLSFSSRITLTRILLLSFVVSNLKSMPFVWTVSLIFMQK